jgi:hypothetical protein
MVAECCDDTKHLYHRLDCPILPVKPDAIQFSFVSIHSLAGRVRLMLFGPTCVYKRRARASQPDKTQSPNISQLEPNSISLHHPNSTHQWISSSSLCPPPLSLTLPPPLPVTRSSRLPLDALSLRRLNSVMRDDSFNDNLIIAGMLHFPHHFRLQSLVF